MCRMFCHLQNYLHDSYTKISQMFEKTGITDCKLETNIVIHFNTKLGLKDDNWQVRIIMNLEVV